MITVGDREVKGTVYNVTSFRVSSCICVVKRAMDQSDQLQGKLLRLCGQAVESTTT